MKFALLEFGAGVCGLWIGRALRGGGCWSWLLDLACQSWHLVSFATAKNEAKGTGTARTACTACVACTAHTGPHTGCGWSEMEQLSKAPLWASCCFAAHQNTALQARPTRNDRPIRASSKLNDFGTGFSCVGSHGEGRKWSAQAARVTLV